MKSETYIKLFTEIKQKIKESQLKTAVAANSQMLLLYWQLGNSIIANQQEKGWGAKIIDHLATDLKKEFPQLKGFSTRSLKYMKRFAETYDIKVLKQFIQIEQSLKTSGTLTQAIARRIFDVDNDNFLKVQQSVALLESPQVPAIVQQVVAQFQEAEYPLKGYNNAIGISDYQFSRALPEELKSSLPQIEDLEKVLMNEEE